MRGDEFTTASLLKSLSAYPVSKGDFDGHPFRGNQYRTGEGGFPNAKVTSPKEFLSAFSSAFKGNPYSAFVNHYTLAQIKAEKMTPLLSPDGRTGCLIHDHGDGRIEATALFSKGVSGSGAAMLHDAIKNHGVNYVECFGEHLPQVYGKLGFRDTEVMPFNKEYAPSDWDYEKFGTPDYHIMELKNVTKSADEKAIRDAAKAKMKPDQLKYEEALWRAAQAVLGSDENK